MFQSSSRLLTAVTACLVLLSASSLAQPTLQDRLVSERHQKVIAALGQAGLVVSPSVTPAPPLLSLLKQMKDWAELPDPEPPKTAGMPGLEKIIGDTFPRSWERLGRFNQFKVEGQEQPRTVLAYQSPTSTTTVPILNPDHVLFKYTVTSAASEFFPTTQNVADQIKSFTDAGGKAITPAMKVLCKTQENPSRPVYGPEQIASCLSKTRKRDIFYRFVSGYNGTFSYSDNPQVVQNIIITSGTAQASQNRLFSGEVMFDPSNVFLSGTDWKNLSASQAVYDGEVQKHVITKVAKRCPGIDVKGYIPTTACMEKLAGPTGWTRVAAALLPTVDYKIQTQFDFIKSGANFIVPPYPLGHLYDFSFTQDFRRVFPTAKQRQDAVAAIATFTKYKPNKPVSERRQAILSDFKSVALDESRLADDDWYYKFIDKISALI